MRLKEMYFTRIRWNVLAYLWEGPSIRLSDSIKENRWKWHDDLGPKNYCSYIFIHGNCLISCPDFSSYLVSTAALKKMYLFWKRNCFVYLNSFFMPYYVGALFHDIWSNTSILTSDRIKCRIWAPRWIRRDRKECVRRCFPKLWKRESPSHR